MKIKYFSLLAFVFYILTSAPVFAQINSGGSEVDNLIKDFFKGLYEEKKIDETVDKLYATNKWFVAADAKEQVKKQFHDFNNGPLGKYFGYELITQVNQNDFLIIRSFVLKYDRQPIRINFTFYKPNDKWFLYGIKIDDGIDDDLEDKLKKK